MATPKSHFSPTVTTVTQPSGWKTVQKRLFPPSSNERQQQSHRKHHFKNPQYQPVTCYKPISELLQSNDGRRWRQWGDTKQATTRRARRHDWGRDGERDQSFLTLPAVCLKPSGKKERTGMYEEETEEKEVGEEERMTRRGRGSAWVIGRREPGRGKEDGAAGETWIFLLDARKIIWFELTFKIDFSYQYKTFIHQPHMTFRNDAEDVCLMPNRGLIPLIL